MRQSKLSHKVNIKQKISRVGEKLTSRTRVQVITEDWKLNKQLKLSLFCQTVYASNFSGEQYVKCETLKMRVLKLQVFVLDFTTARAVKCSFLQLHAFYN